MQVGQQKGKKSARGKWEKKFLRKRDGEQGTGAGSEEGNGKWGEQGGTGEKGGSRESKGNGERGQVTGRGGKVTGEERRLGRCGGGC
jgi:hypothetical protein